MKSENNNNEDDWNPKKNSIVRVNSWKTGLTNKELKSIENVCVETLSKMEYQLLSAPWSGSYNNIVFDNIYVREFYIEIFYI